MEAPSYRVHVDRSAESGFRRRAIKAFPLEYIETMWGYIDGADVYICAFMPLRHTATQESLVYTREEVQEQTRDAKAYNLLMLGTIHTHPHHQNGLFSENDLIDVQTSGETIFGILAIEEYMSKRGQRRRCHIAYWPGVLPLKVTYTRWRG